MTMIHSIEILQKVIERLKSSSSLCNYVEDRIYNFSRQESLLPYIRARISNISDFDTKTELGYETDIIIDVWSNYHGDKEVLEITDVIKNLFHRNEFTSMSFQSLITNLSNIVSFVETDGETTHTILTFNALFMEA